MLGEQMWDVDAKLIKKALKKDYMKMYLVTTKNVKNLLH